MFQRIIATSRLRKLLTSWHSRTYEKTWVFNNATAKISDLKEIQLCSL